MTPPLLIASDIDGTYLNEMDRVSRRTKEVTWRIHRAGVPFVFATGRPPRWIHPVTEQVGVRPLAVCANGAIVYDSAADRVLDVKALGREELAAIVDIVARELPGAGFAVERCPTSVFRGTEQVFLAEPEYDHAWLNPDHEETTRADLLGAPAVKLLARRADLTSAEMLAAVVGVIGDLADITYSTDEGLLEFARPGVTKAGGLAFVAERLGVDPSGVIAFGDMPNDVDMLRWAGRGVAMGNADAAVRAVADEVTSTNAEDGVAEVLERWW